MDTATASNIDMGQAVSKFADPLAGFVRRDVHKG